MIQIEDLSFSFPNSSFHLRVPELKVSRSSKQAIVGPSGSGKTTLLQLIAGIYVPESGDVLTNGVRLCSMSERERRRFRVCNIGLVFQEFELLEHLNVLDNILLACRLTSAIRLQPKHRDRAKELARELALEDKLTRGVRMLSQGERQRVAICRALLLEPPLLLCDEPTGNLDPQSTDHVLDLLFDYVDRAGTTLLTVTHDHSLLPRFDDAIDCRHFHTGGEDGR